jgi:transmembrane sensor
MTRIGETEDPIERRAQAEAAAWMALLHSPERNAVVEASLLRWIAAHPSHAIAWETATNVWNETGDLVQHIPPRHVPRRRPSKTFWIPVAAVAATCLAVAGIYIKDTLISGVTTTIGEQRTLTLEDGTRVELNTDSRLQVDFDRHLRAVTLKSGEAYFQVAHETRPFVVIAGDRKIVALGTEFTVRREQTSDESLTVTLIEGRVAVEPVGVSTTSSAEAPTAVTVLNPGERLRVSHHSDAKVDAPSIDKVTGWMRGQLIFDHTPLHEAATEFSRYSSVKITVMSPGTREIPVGGIFRISDAKSFARAVAQTYKLRLTRRGNELVLEPAAQSSDAQVPTNDPTTAR